MKKRPLDVLVVLLLVLGAGLFVGLHVDGYTKLSPIDEMQHIDYLDRVPEAPALGDKVGQYAMRSQACRGVDAPGFVSPACGLEEYDPAAYQERGYNTAALNPPVYYVVTRLVAETLVAVTPADDLVTGARLAGALWLALGLVITYGVARRRGASTLAGAAVCGLLLAAPAMIYASSTVNPDSFALLWGAILLALLTWWESAPSVRRGALLVLVAGLATAVKFTFVMAPAAIAAYLLFRLLSERSTGAAQPTDDGPPIQPGRLGRWTGILTSAAVVGLPLLVAVSWMEFQGTRPQQDPSNLPAMSLAFHVPSFPWLMLYDNAFVFLGPLSSPWVIVGTPQLATFVSALVTLTLSGGVFAAAFCGIGSTANQLLARAALLAAVVFGLGLTTVNYLTMDSYFPLPARYGSTLLPFFAIVTASALRTRAGAAAVAALAVVGLAVSTWRLAGFA